MKRLLILLLPICLLLAGCTRATEVRDRSFIQAIGMDGIIPLSVTLTGFSNSDVISGSGKTLFAAIEQAESTQEKSLFLGHTELLAIGVGNFRSHLTLLLKEGAISPSCKLVYATDGAAALLRGTDASDLLAQMQRLEQNGMLLPSNCSDVLEALLAPDGKAVLPCTDGTGFTMAVVNENTVEGMLDDAACRGISWIRQKQHDLTLSLDTGDAWLNFNVQSAYCKPSVSVTDNQLTLMLDFSITGSAVEGETLAVCQPLVEACIRSWCDAAILQTAQQYAADVLDIARMVQRTHPDFYAAHSSDWAELLRNCRVDYRFCINK